MRLAQISRRVWRIAYCVLLLAACRGTPPSPTATSIPPTLQPAAFTPNAATTPTALPTPTPGPRTLTIGLASDPGTLDPAEAVDESALLITRHLYEGLTAYEPGGTRAIPALAEAWDTSADGLKWTFHLRPGVRFSDGTPLTADSAARNFKRWLNRTPPGDYAFWHLMFGGFAGESDENGEPLSLLTAADAPDEATLTLTLRRPDAALPATLAMPSFALVNPIAFETGSAFGARGTASAGTGPFVLDGWRPESLIHLIRNPNYWGAPSSEDPRSGAEGTPDELIFKIIPDDTQRFLALQVGEIEGMAHLNPKDYAAAQTSLNTRMDFDPALNVLYLGFNQAHVPWGNLDCRLAVAFALNKARYVQEFFPGDADAALAMQPPAVWGYDASRGDRAHDPEQAKQHWATCVDAIGQRNMPDQITFYVPPEARSYLPYPAALGAALQADLASVGITVTLTSPDWQRLWLPDVHAGRADLFLLGWVGVNGDPDSFLCPLFCGNEAAFNSDGKGDPLPADEALATLLTSAHAATVQAQRESLYAQVHARIFDVVPAIPLAHRKTAWAYRAEVVGNVPSPIEDVFFNLTLAP
jgi:peptide/nickel transport system substrate-binding protein